MPAEPRELESSTTFDMISCSFGRSISPAREDEPVRRERQRDDRAEPTNRTAATVISSEPTGRSPAGWRHCPLACFESRRLAAPAGGPLLGRRCPAPPIASPRGAPAGGLDGLREQQMYHAVIYRAAFAGPMTQERGVSALTDVAPATPTPRVRRASDVDGLARYLQEISAHRLLSAEEEVDLARRIAEGSAAQRALDHSSAANDPATRMVLERTIRDADAARRTLVEGNLRLVVSVAKRFRSTGVPLLDLIQDGNIGLIQAIEGFDGRRGFRFSTYATWWIRQAVTRGIERSSRVVPLPATVNRQARTVQLTAADLEQRLGRTPTSDEVAEAMGISEQAVEKLRVWSAPARSLQDTTGPVGTQLEDRIPDDTQPSPSERAESAARDAEVRGLLAHLDDRERSIVALRYGLDPRGPCSARQVAEQWGLSSNRIHQIERRAMAKLRHPAGAASHQAALRLEQSAP